MFQLKQRIKEKLFLKMVNDIAIIKIDTDANFRPIPIIELHMRAEEYLLLDTLSRCSRKRSANFWKNWFYVYFIDINAN